MPQATVTLTDSPGWKDQGIENLAKSPHAKLRDIPVRAVTITGGFWGQRREINVTRSIPTMHDLLEANGRMNNFLPLGGQERQRRRAVRFIPTPMFTSGPRRLGLCCNRANVPSFARPLTKSLMKWSPFRNPAAT